MAKKENSVNDIKFGNFIFDVFETRTGDLGFTVRLANIKKDTHGDFVGPFVGPFVDIYVNKDDIHKITFG